MRKVKAQTKEGKDVFTTTGKPVFRYYLETGDKFTPLYDSVKELDNGGAVIACEVDQEQETVYITLTQGQTKSIKKLGNLKGVLLETYPYTNKYTKDNKPFIGIRKVA